MSLELDASGFFPPPSCGLLPLSIAEPFLDCFFVFHLPVLLLFSLYSFPSKIASRIFFHIPCIAFAGLSVDVLAPGCVVHERFDSNAWGDFFWLGWELELLLVVMWYK